MAKHRKAPDGGDLEYTNLLLSPASIISYDFGGYRVQSTGILSGKVEWEFDRRSLNIRGPSSNPFVSINKPNTLLSLTSNEESFVVVIDTLGNGRLVYTAKARGIGLIVGEQIYFVGSNTFAVVDVKSGRIVRQVETGYKSHQDGLISFERCILAMDIGQNHRDLLLIDSTTGNLRARVHNEPGFSSIRQSVIHGHRWLGRVGSSFAVVNLHEARVEYLSKQQDAIERIGAAGDSACWISPSKPPPNQRFNQLFIFDLKTLSVRKTVEIPIEFATHLWVHGDKVLVGGHGIACLSLSSGSTQWAVGSSRLSVHSLVATDDFIVCAANRDQIHCYSWDSLNDTGM